MYFDAITNFTEASTTTGFFSPCTGFVNRRCFILHRVVVQNAIKVFVGKRVAHAYIHEIFRLSIAVSNENDSLCGCLLYTSPSPRDS